MRAHLYDDTDQVSHDCAHLIACTWQSRDVKDKPRWISLPSDLPHNL